MEKQLKSRVDPRVLLSAGWTPEDLRWEELMEEASDAAFADALGLAREHFEACDPRLAASLIGYAVVLERAGDPAAQRLLEEACAIWTASKDWVSALRPERRSRSATYHLRLERRYDGQYDRFSQERYEALRMEGVRTAEAHLSGGETEDRRARWWREKPKGFDDHRRLLAALCLMPPRR